MDMWKSMHLLTTVKVDSLVYMMDVSALVVERKPITHVP
jgi:hypothetical protein